MIKQNLFTLVFLCTTLMGAFAQDVKKGKIINGQVNQAIKKIKRDTLRSFNNQVNITGAQTEEQLEEIVINQSKEEVERDRTMRILRRRILRVYPYVVVASENLLDIYKNMDDLESSRAKKKYLKAQEKRLKKQFKDPIKKLSKKDGKILLKLIYRQTGKSTYHLMKELKSGWSAFWSNQLAWFYSIDLKETYQPYDELEDFYIEFLLKELKKSRKINYINPVMNYNSKLLKMRWERRLGKSGYYPEPLD